MKREEGAFVVPFYREQPKQRPPQKKRLNRRIGLWMVVCAAFFAWAGVQLYEQEGEIANKRLELAETKQQLKKVREEQQELKAMVKKLQDPDYIAEVARKEYYMTKPGEVLYVETE